jgi:hypothetical protein
VNYCLLEYLKDVPNELHEQKSLMNVIDTIGIQIDVGPSDPDSDSKTSAQGCQLGYAEELDYDL